MDEKQLGFAPGAGAVVVDLNKLVESRALAQANSGAGKSTLLRALLEQTHGRIQQLVLDPEGEFATLREKFDYVVAAKRGADVEASPRTSAMLARRLMELNASAIMDLYDLTKEDRRRFVSGFLNELMVLPREQWHPVLVVLDEIHEFAPEKGHGEAISTEAVIDAASRGRKRMVCLVGATQRISKLHKDVAAELLNKFVGRTSLDVDLKRAGDELGMDKVTRNALKVLSAGQFHCYGPAVSNEVVLVRGPLTKTRPPKAGHGSVAPPPAPEKVRAMLAKLADLPKEAEDRELSIESLQRQVLRLQAELRTAERSLKTQAPKVETVTKTVFDPQDMKRLESVVEREGHLLESMKAKLTELSTDAAQYKTKFLELMRNTTPKTVQVPGNGYHVMSKPEFNEAMRQVVQRPVIVPHAEDRTIDNPNTEKVGEGERRVLIACAQFDEGVTRDQVTQLTKFKRSTRDAYLQRLRQRGLVAETTTGSIVATENGKVFLGPAFKRLPTGDALREHWLQELPEGEASILRALCEQFPSSVARDALTQYKRSTRDAYIQRLSARKLVEVYARGVAASPMLFDRGAA